MTWTSAIDVLRQDVRYAWRSVARTPGFALLVVLTFTLGIGVNAATFSVLDMLFLKPPGGVERPGELRRIWQKFRGEGGTAFYGQAVSGPQYRALVDVAGQRLPIALYTREQHRLGQGVRSREVEVEYASASYFSTLGVRSALGRFYTADEDRRGNGSPLVVLSDRLWRSYFGAERTIIGRAIRLSGTTYTIVGVAPPSFKGVGLSPADLWIPIAALAQPEWAKEPLLDMAGMFRFFAIVRVPEGFPVADFERRASLRTRELNRERFGETDTLSSVVLAPIQEARGPGRPDQERLISTRLAGVAAIVLLIACANVINLFLARAVRRRREVAVRLALGVSRARLAAFLAMETVLLALIAGLAALLVAWWAAAVLRAMLLPQAGSAPVMDSRLVLFTLGAAAAAGIAAGVVPALQASKPDLTRALKAGGGHVTLHRSRLRNTLVILQAALSVVLLVGAALFIRSLKNVEGLDIGYDADRLIFGSVRFDPGQAPPRPLVAAKVDEIAARLSSVAGVEAVTREGMTPFGGFAAQRFYADRDSVLPARSEATYLNVSSSYFRTVGLRLLRGSIFDDRRGAPREIVVNDAMAKIVWPGRDPIGQCVRLETSESPCHWATHSKDRGHRRRSSSVLVRAHSPPSARSSRPR